LAVIKLLYVVFTAQLVFKYFAFMTCVVQQLTSYLGINFLTVKQKSL